MLIRNFKSIRVPTMIWLPSFIIGTAMLLPVVYLVIRAFQGNQESFDLLFRWRTILVFVRTFLLVSLVSITCTLIALPIAWLTSKTDIPMKRIWFILCSIPLVIPSYVGSFLFISVLGPKGFIYKLILAPLGFTNAPDIYGLPGAILVLSLLSYPYVLLTTRSVLSSINPSLEESAQILGYSRWKTLMIVTVPQLSPAIAAGGLLVGLYVLSDFGAVSLLRYETFTWAIYQQYQSSFDRNIAATLSLALVGFAILLLMMEGRERKKMKYYTSGPGTTRVYKTVQLGIWKWPAIGFCTVTVILSLILPLTILIYWLIRGISSGEPLMMPWIEIGNSVYTSAIACIITVICSVPVALLSVRHANLFSRIIDKVSYVGYALPGIVVALTLVFFAINFMRPAYQTIWLLIFAYFVLFFPAALGTTRASILQINPKIEEAARSLGRTSSEVMYYVTTPLIRPGILMGAALVFLLTMKELPATLILSPLDFKTLATSTWSASSEAYFTQAAIPAICLILISTVPLAFLLINEHKYGRESHEGLST